MLDTMFALVTICTNVGLFVAVNCGLISSANVSSHRFSAQYKEHLMLNSLLGNGSLSRYDWRIRPRGLRSLINSTDVRSVTVSANLYLRTLSEVDDINMEYSLHFTFREEWVDERLLFNSTALKHLTLQPGRKIWMPDTFFQNEKGGRKHNIDKPNVLIRIYNGTGRVLYSVRLTLTLSCPMSLKNYPMDIQTCYVEFSSYAYTTADIQYVWNSAQPIQVKDGLLKSLPTFRLADFTTGYCTSVTNTGTYSCLRLTFLLKRQFSYYLLQLYLPSFMLVGVSWVSFWLDKDSVPARVTLGVTTLLTMTTQASGISASLPPVSYTKAIDVWIGVCLAFIFGALLEFALVNYAAQQELKRVRRNDGLRSAFTPPQPKWSFMMPLLHARQIELEAGDKEGNPHKTSTLNISGPRSLGDVTESPRPSTGLMVTMETVRSPLIVKTKSVEDDDSYPFRRIDEYEFKRNGCVGGSSVVDRRRFRHCQQWRNRHTKKTQRIDLLARLVFPVTFGVFNVIYWCVYLLPYLEVNKLG